MTPRANLVHRIEDVSFRRKWISCICGWSTKEDDLELAWLRHRQTYGLTRK